MRLVVVVIGILPQYDDFDGVIWRPMECIEDVTLIGMNFVRRILFVEEFEQIPIRLRFEGVAQDFAPIVMENIGRFHIFVLSLLLRAVVRLLRQNSKLKKRNGVMTQNSDLRAFEYWPFEHRRLLHYLLVFSIIDEGEIYREVEAKVGSGEFRAVDP